MDPQPLEPSQRANHSHHAHAPLATAPNRPEPEWLADQADDAGPALEMRGAALGKPDGGRAKDGEGGLDELIRRHPAIVHHWMNKQSPDNYPDSGQFAILRKLAIASGLFEEDRL